jgi:acyl-CoA thioester hydrolase
METPAPLMLHRAAVLPDWVDYNGHMSEAYYVLVFGHATDAFLDHIGIDDATRRRTRTSLYTVEAHIHYLREAHAGDALRVETRVLGHDAKRVHLYHAMMREPDEALLSSTELMLLHVDTAAGRTAPIPPLALARLAAVAGAQATLPRPSYAGRSIGLPARGADQP